MTHDRIGKDNDKSLSLASLSDCANGQVERTLKRTESFEVTERPFTTEPKRYIKRGCNTVRSRCLQYIEKLSEEGWKYRVPMEMAQQVFSETLGIFDRASMKAYFGTQKGQSKRRIRRWARYQSGTTSVKDLELTQDIPKRVGYLEKLQLVSFSKEKTSNNGGYDWFMYLENPSLIPTLLNESCSAPCSIDKISLNLFSQEEGSEGNRFEKVPLDGETIETQQTHTLQSEREISRVKVKHTEYASKHIPQLTLEDKFVFADGGRVSGP